MTVSDDQLQGWMEKMCNVMSRNVTYGTACQYVHYHKYDLKFMAIPEKSWHVPVYGWWYVGRYYSVAQRNVDCE